jgi:hypothetical protein
MSDLATQMRDTIEPAYGFAAFSPERNAKPQAAVHAAEGGSAAAVPARPTMASSLATLFTTHILQDGEIVLLIVKPSAWFILVSPMRFLAAVLIFVIAGVLLGGRLEGKNLLYFIDVGIFLMAGRLMWATLQWMGQVYVLTDRRILTLSGIFSIDIFDCPLRKVARTRIAYTTRERVFRLGTIQIIPSSDEMPDSAWQMVAKPAEVHEMLVATINKSKQGGLV